MEVQHVVIDHQFRMDRKVNPPSPVMEVYNHNSGEKIRQIPSEHKIQRQQRMSDSGNLIDVYA